jgi:hypothetical protein
MSQWKIRKKAAKQKMRAQQPDKPTPRGLFQQAESFFQSAVLLFNNATQIPRYFNPQFIFPSLVCEAFSLELYLKCVIVIEESEYPATHDLEKLYALITAENRTEIEKICSPHMAQQQSMQNAYHQHTKQPGAAPTVTFQSMLHASHKAFETFRYVHEKNTLSDGEGWQGGPIVRSVRERLMILRPEWRNFRFVEPTKPPEPPAASPTP